MNRARLNLALLVVVAGLGTAVYFAQATKEPAGPPLTPLKPDAVSHVVIDHPGSPSIELQKHGGEWSLAAPVKGEADPLEVNALTGLADHETKRTLEGAKLAELGLDPPAYTVRLDDQLIAFGGQEPIEFRRYVKVGAAVSLIEDPPSAALDADYSDLVAKNLFPLKLAITRVELKGLTLDKGADAKWALTPADPQASADQVQKLVDGWKTARSMWNEAVKDPAGVKGDAVRITLSDGSTRDFVVAATEPQLKLFDRSLGINYVLSKALADDILKLPAPQEPAKADEAATPAEPAPK